MKLIFFLVAVLRLGSMATEYESSNTTILHCIFPENSTRTEFTFHFHYEDGKTDLLVDCVWKGDEPDCTEQKGFKCRLLVPNTVEIEVPQRYVTRPGKIGYTLSGGDPSNAIFCNFVGNHSEGQKESQNKSQQNNIKENNYDHKASKDVPVWVIGLAIGPVLPFVVIGAVLYKKVSRRNTRTPTQEELDAESPSLAPTENSSSDDNSSQPSVKYHLVCI